MKQEDRQKIENAVNPFTFHEFVKVREITVTNKMVNVDDIQDGIVVSPPLELKHKLLLDNEPMCKVFNRMAFRLHILALKDDAKLLFLWMIYEISPGKDYIELGSKQSKRYIAETGKSYKSWGLGIKGLIDASIIAQTSVSKVYWFNPLFLFNGNRVDKYSDKLIE